MEPTWLAPLLRPQSVRLRPIWKPVVRLQKRCLCCARSLQAFTGWVPPPALSPLPCSAYKDRDNREGIPWQGSHG